MHYTGWNAAVEDADGYVYVGVVQRYRKLKAGRDKGKVLWTVKYKMEDEGSNSEELDMRECASLPTRWRARTPRARADRIATTSSVLVPPSHRGAQPRD
jgi:hypothetical protein